jgi:transposase
VGPPHGRACQGLGRQATHDRWHQCPGASLGGDFKKSHPDRCLGRSRGGLTTKIHALTDDEGLPLKLSISPGQTHDINAAEELLGDIQQGQIVLGDKGYDANWLRELVKAKGAFANIPARALHKIPPSFSAWHYRKRNFIERFFNKLKYFRRIATRYDKLGSHFLAMAKLACIRLRLRHYESTA